MGEESGPSGTGPQVILDNSRLVESARKRMGKDLEDPGLSARGRDVWTK